MSSEQLVVSLEWEFNAQRRRIYKYSQEYLFK